MLFERTKVARHSAALLVFGFLLPPVPQAAQGQTMPPLAQPASLGLAAPQAENKEANILSCKFRKSKPILDFQYRFFTGYQVDIPVRQLLGPENVWTITMVIRPTSVEKAEPFHFQEYIKTDAIAAGSKGKVELTGSFVLGEGFYEVDWRLQDQRGRGCALNWQVKAKLSRRQRGVALTLEPGEIASSMVYLFREEPNIQGGSNDRHLRVKVLANFDLGRRRRRATIQLWRYVPLISTLRALSRHPQIVEFSVVAYSVEEQQVLFRQDFVDYIDFPGLGKVIEQLSPATVKFEQLGKNKERDFVANLIAGELGSAESVDALIFAGADPLIGRKIPQQSLGSLPNLNYPIFFLNTPRHPWRGIIGNTVRSLKGRESKIHTPQGLSAAIDKMVSRINQAPKS